jgi:succinate dehydrogenase / fumarate reductase cytochrome b subunit
VLGFQVWWVAGFYLVAQGLLFVHLGHGIASACQSFGLRNHLWWPRIQFVARAASTAIFIGYALIPATIFFRVVGADYADQVRAKVQASPPAAPAAASQDAKETH